MIAGRSTVVKLAANRRAATNAAKLTAAISKRCVDAWPIAGGNTATVYVKLTPITRAVKIK
ncbi:MAG: hypothetical protein LC775_01025 [Acidobacteria bacterium]|nr:hypothetical protein [Acidobacteriota bacterium]MCA1604082.1 hypothetical protein [Acidobacteriota bacterium]